MAGENVGFNGTTVSFNGTAIAGIRSVRYQGSCAHVPVTGSDAIVKLCKPGLPSETLTVVVVGSNALSKGATGAIVVAWSDGGTDGSMTKARLMSGSMSGSLDGDNTKTLIFRSSK